MNHLYRLVWSPAHQALIAVSELTLGPGKHSVRKLSIALMATASAVIPLAHAGPQGGQITAGAGSISQAGNTTTVTQGSQNLSVNWQSFNTSSAESVKFVQPSSSAIAVNRIADANPTQFLGQLDANGKVYLVNPNGIVFGAGSQVNVGGLVASTLDISDRALSEATQTFSGAGTGSIVNQGSITTHEGGYVAFLGNKVDNQGTIKTAGGATALGAGSEVTLSFTGDKLVNLQVDKSTLQGLANNGGLIQADGGAVVMSAGARDALLASVVNNTGIVQARSVQNINGTIVLGGGAQSTVSNSGILEASGVQSGQTGGTVKVLGDTVRLAAQGSIDVSGDTAGGTALVGGNFLGAGPERTAKTVTVAAGSTLKADAISQGKGGKVAVWSDDSTTFNGAISAKAGQHGGDGGSVETSGKRLSVGSTATVTTSAPQGQSGQWLLDPQDFRIGGFTAEAHDIDYAQLTQALKNSNVTIKTGQSATCSGVSGCAQGVVGNGDIILQDGISIGGSDWSGSTTLTLSALRNIQFEGSASIDASSGNGSIVLRADNTGTSVGTVIMGDSGTVYANTGSVKFYYNPTSYASPTDYAGRTDPVNGNLLVNATNFEAYMLVNYVPSIASKVYDGTTSAVITGFSPRGGVPVDANVDTSNATAAFADANAGTGKALVISGVTLGGSGASKYAINGLDNLTADISKANLLSSGISATDKTYDGTSTATVSGTMMVSGIFAGDSVSVSGSGVGSTFDSKNVGSNKAVTVSGYTLGGTSAGNYNLVMPTGLSAAITPASLTVQGITANSKTYDGSTSATLSGTASVAALGSDAVSVSGSGVASFANRNAASNQLVSVTGYTLTGADAGNYLIVQPTGLSATISKAGLAVSGIAAANKTYDGTTSAALSGTAAVAAVAGDVVAVSGSGSGVFADKNAGVNKVVSVSGYVLSGADAGNYELVQPQGLTATIAKADLAVSGLSANGKTYDGAAVAVLNGTATVTAIGSDIVNLSGSASGNFVDKNAGAGKAVSVTGLALSGVDAGNYNLVLPNTLTADIAKASLGVTGIAVADKVYDGTTAATLVGTASVAAFGNDAVSVSGVGTAAFADKNAGANKVVSATGYTLAGADAGNYDVTQPTGLNATIHKADIAVAGISAADKTYDGTTVATVVGTASVSGYGADVLALSGSGSGVFSDRNAGSGKAVVVSGYTLSGADASNYTLVQPAGLTATIGKAGLVLSGLGASSKTYDGTTAATMNGTASVAALGADAVTVTGSASGAFADKNAGVGKSVLVSGLTLAGADASNYTLVQPTLTADIAKASLGISGVVAADKTYDGTAAATLNGSATVAAFGSDVVSVADTSAATFVDKNVGAGKAVTVTGFTLTGADAGNYDLVQPTGLNASITRADITVVGVTAADKTYDGTTAATLSGIAQVNGYGSDLIAVNGSGSGAFADKSAGSGKGVSVSGYSLSGADAGNYNLIQPTRLTANIDKANLVLTGLVAHGKTYDGTATASLGGTASVTALGADAVFLSGIATGAFADKNAGAGKVVSVSGYALSGADAGNYTLVQPTGLTADIARAKVGVTGISAAGKVYDGTPVATLIGAAQVSAFGGDAVSVSTTGTAAFADKNVGTGKTVTVAGYTLLGADAGNYTLVQPTGLTADITKASIGLTGLAAASKVYDGTTVATLLGDATVAGFGGDALRLDGSGLGTFSDKNAGSGKAVTVSGYSLGGADAGNYILLQPAGLTATIDKANLNLTGLVANSKIYDGTTLASLSGTASVSAIQGDSVALSGAASGAFADKQAGTGKVVSVSGLELTGADAGNYTLVQPTGLTADIGRALLRIEGVSVASKTYDGSTAARLVGTASVNPFGSDSVSLDASGTATFADKNVGTAKAVTVGGYRVSGVDAGNYILLAPSGLAADITPASLTVSGISASSKVFDASTAAVIDVSRARLDGLFAGDQVMLASAGAFADAAVGTDKTVNLSNRLSGQDSRNYQLAGQTTTLADISALPTTPITPTPITPTPPAQPVITVQNAVAQVQSSILAPQAAARPQALSLSSTLDVRDAQQASTEQRREQDGRKTATLDTASAFATPAPLLSIQNGGVQLPPVADSTQR